MNELNFLHAHYIDYILDNYGKKLEFTESAKANRKNHQK